MDSINDMSKPQDGVEVTIEKIAKVKSPDDLVVLKVKRKTRDLLKRFKIVKRETEEEILSRVLSECKLPLFESTVVPPVSTSGAN